MVRSSKGKGVKVPKKAKKQVTRVTRFKLGVKKDGKDFGPKVVFRLKAFGSSNSPRVLDPTHHSVVVLKENRSPNEVRPKVVLQCDNLGIFNLVPLEQRKKFINEDLAIKVASSHA